MAVLLQHRHRLAKAQRSALNRLAREVAESVLATMECPASAEISILLTEDGEMRDLNRTYRGLARPTDVLSFCQEEGGNLAPGDTRLLGDVAISLETAQRQAGESGHSLRMEIAILLVHGILHLLGFAHHEGKKPKDIQNTRRMHAAEKACIRNLQGDLII